MPSTSIEPPSLVLASASPRRRELLTQIGVSFAVQVADVDESVNAGESPEAYVTRLAIAKARAVVAGGCSSPVLGADTSVVIDGKILGKPESAADAVAMLRLLSGREHSVMTAVALCRADETAAVCSQSRVWFRERDDALIARYVASGEPMDKAGSYGIQGLGAVFVTRIDGSYSGVVGLPLAETADLLLAGGIGIWRHA